MRKKTLGTLIAAGALALVAAGFGIRLWSNDQLNAMPMFWAVHVAPDGRVLAELDDQLYIESPDGQSQQVIPLSKFGVKGFEGDFAILSDDSVILQKGELPPQSAHDVIRALARTREEAPDTDTAGAVPLQRCSLKTLDCTALTGPGDYFKVRRTFKLCVDEQAQRIYVADTDQQRLVMLDYTGKILTSKEGELQFPNQLQITAPGELTVVDTNHNRFVTYAVTPDAIGAQLKSVPQAEWLGIPMNAFLFPTGFVQTGDGGQWAIIAGDNLTQGKLFQRASATADAQFVRLPPGADVLTLAATDHDVLVPDNGNYRIHAIGYDGGDHGDFGSDALNEALGGYAAQHRLYRGIFTNSLWVMLLLAAPLLFYAMRLQRAVEDDADVAAPVGRSDVGGDHELVDAAAVEQNCLSAGGAGIVPLQPASPFEFRRHWGTRRLANSSFALAVVTAAVLALPLMIIYLDYQIHQRHPQAPWLLLDWRMLLFFGLFSMLLIWRWSSFFMERVFVHRLGIGYQSLFSGPLELLSFLRPSWALRWDEVAEMRLCSRGKGGSPASWYYLVRAKQGAARRLSALAWKLHGQDDGNPQYQPGAWMDADTLRSTIYGTALYQLIGRRGQLSVSAMRPAAAPLAPSAARTVREPAAAPTPLWQTVPFYGAIFWLLVCAHFYVDAHLPAAFLKTALYRSLWQAGFVLTTAGMLYSAVPKEKRGHFVGAHSVLVLFFGPLTVPFYLWSWYGWKRALRFTALALVYLIVVGTAMELVNGVMPGIFAL
ncbi:MAG TPA: hypothetical protein VGT99_13965 [Gammaproteobacteria bacterium]|nr:hypothetical protein [Gammaproteobacteria bacterium]